MLKTLSYKKIPHLTLTTLPPPYPNYAYFEEHKIFPFDPYSTAFNLPNAWWLAEVSTLVYAESDVVLPLFKNVGLKEVSFFETGSTQCFVAANNRFAIVGFRGSEMSEQSGSGIAEHFLQGGLNGHKDLAGSGESFNTGPIPDAIRDYVPLFYAVLLWNNLVAGENSSAKDDEDRRPLV